MATAAAPPPPAFKARTPPPPRVRLGSRAAVVNLVVLAGLVALTVWACTKTDVSVSTLVDGWTGMRDFVGEAIPPSLDWDEVIRPGLDAALLTLYIGFLGTLFGLPASLLFAVLGARNTTPNPVVFQLARGIMSTLRAIPEVVYALIFLTAVGLGPFPGVLALAVHTVGVLGKLFSEAIEEADGGPSDALRVAGASRWQVVVHAVLPSVTPTFVGLTLYRLDSNVRASLVLGLVGAGGVGFFINQSIKLFRFDEMLTYILIVLVMVIAVDLLSSVVRKRIAD